jgi:transposase
LLYLFVLGVPVYRSRRYLTVTMKTAQRVFTMFREAIYAIAMEELKTLAFTGTIEMDETLFGGKRHGKRGWGSAGKQMVFGMYMRNGKVLTFPISSRSREVLVPLIKDHTKPGSLYYTDDWHAYGSLPVRGSHVVVRKEKGTPKGRDHLNGIEGFWSFAKNWLYQYRGVPQHHFHLYLKEIEFRFNHRSEDLFPLVASFIVKLMPNLVPDVT